MFFRLWMQLWHDGFLIAYCVSTLARPNEFVLKCRCDLERGLSTSDVYCRTIGYMWDWLVDYSMKVMHAKTADVRRSGEIQGHGGWRRPLAPVVLASFSRHRSSSFLRYLLTASFGCDCSTSLVGVGMSSSIQYMSVSSISRQCIASSRSIALGDIAHCTNHTRTHTIAVEPHLAFNITRRSPVADTGGVWIRGSGG